MKKLFSLLFVTLLLSGCFNNEPTLTPLEIQSMQSRSYEADQGVVFASVVSVFQDLGYVIKDADATSGFISAESSTKSDAATQIFLGIAKMEQTLATAYVEPIGNRTSVRVNFVESIRSSSTYGQSDREDRPILDVNLYQNAFERIENAIFIRS
ncbi:MAG: hypothetical protein OXC26_10910 [Albidovulum sp.]|nr:hypothetical protein [Albidovulum sp.]